MPAPNPPVAGGRGGKAGVLVAAEEVASRRVHRTAYFDDNCFLMWFPDNQRDI